MIFISSTVSTSAYVCFWGLGGNNCLRILTICGTNDLPEFGPLRKFNCFPGSGAPASWNF